MVIISNHSLYLELEISLLMAKELSPGQDPLKSESKLVIFVSSFNPAPPLCYKQSSNHPK